MLTTAVVLAFSLAAAASERIGAPAAVAGQSVGGDRDSKAASATVGQGPDLGLNPSSLAEVSRGNRRHKRRMRRKQRREERNRNRKAEGAGPNASLLAEVSRSSQRRHRTGTSRTGYKRWSGKGPVELKGGHLVVNGQRVETPIQPMGQRNASMLERRQKTKDEPVECFCIDYYEYVDFDDYGEYDDPEDCMGADGNHARCNEQCEEEKKHKVWFQNTYQTISFCGDEDGYLDEEDDEVECQCMDGKDTMKHSNVKKARKKGWPDNTITQFANGVSAVFDDGDNSAENLFACYEQCPDVCHSQEKMTGGCAMPTEVSDEDEEYEEE